jgi:uncharacterized RDD family membrane protein YckC
MIKITDLTENKFRTSYKKDAYGNRVRRQEQYTAKRLVRTVRPGPRFGHFVIDFIAFQVLGLSIQYILLIINLYADFDSVFGLSVAFVSSLGGLLLYPFMYFICEYYWQQTPGKFLTQTVVIDEYANKPDFRQIALRSLIRVVPFEPFSCWGDDYSYGWHDKWADTFVVKKDELVLLKVLLKEQENKA